MISKSMALKMKALCFILMFAGQDAARIHSAASSSHAARNVDKIWDDLAGKPNEAEKMWQDANHKCRWRWSRMSCGGGTSCKYRPLPMDVTYSQSCRMSDDGMLNDTDQFFPLQAGVLLAKSQKFAKDCESVNFMNIRASMKCKRRVQHMMRAMTFMSKAEVLNKTKGLPAKDLKFANKSMHESLTALTGAIGDDGSSVLELMDKVKKSAALRQDISGTMGNVTKILWGLLMGSGKMKQDARAMMDDLVEADPTSMTFKSHTEAKGHEPTEEVVDLERIAENLEKFGTDGSTTSSLLEQMPSLLQQMASEMQTQTSTELSEEEEEVHPLLKFIIQVLVFMVIAFICYHFIMDYIFFQVMAPQLTGFSIVEIIQFLIAVVRWIADYQGAQNMALLISGALGLGSAVAVGEALEDDDEYRRPPPMQLAAPPTPRYTYSSGPAYPPPAPPPAIRPIWNGDAMCNGKLADDRAMWLVKNQHMTWVEAQEKVMADFPYEFRGR